MAIYKFAGFWRRFIAYMIDGFIIGVALIILMIVAGVAYFAGSMTHNSAAVLAKMADPEQVASLTLWIWAFSIFMNLAYFTYFHGSTGRTPGKMLLGLQVVTVEGRPLNFGTAFLRSVGYLISSLVFCLGYIWIGFDRKKQGWHDKIAGTVVILRETDGNTDGISISDSAGVSSTESTGTGMPPEGRAFGEPSGEETARPDNQKMP